MLSNFTGGTRRSTKVNYYFIILTTLIVRVPGNNYFLLINPLKTKITRFFLQNGSTTFADIFTMRRLARREGSTCQLMVAWWHGSIIWGRININTVKAWDRMEQFRREQEAFHDPQPSHSAGSRQVRIRWSSVPSSKLDDNSCCFFFISLNDQGNIRDFFAAGRYLF